MRLFLCALFCLPALTLAQQTLSLDDALRLAKENNGTVRAAEYQVKAAGANVAISKAAFYPSITPNVQWNNQRTESNTGLGTQAFTSDETSSGLNATWRILDSGERDLTLRGSRKSQEAERYSATQTLRNVLFDVQQQYYDALRAQELQKVADAQVDRANTVLEQTKARVLVKDAAAKDILQAQADYLNAKVQALQAKNQTATTAASLKATLGLVAERPLPELAAVGDPAPESLPALATMIDDGLTNRADLQASRLNLASQDFTWRRQRRNASWSFSLDGNLGQTFTPDSLMNRTLSFLLSYPLFDGGQLRETARGTEYQIRANQAVLTQNERQVRAEIESAYNEAMQNQDRLEASKAAVEAARENYNAATEAQRLGAGSLIEVLTAQVSLVTAESNAIEARYDLLTSETRLQLVTGQKMRGE